MLASWSTILLTFLRLFLSVSPHLLLHIILLVNFLFSLSLFSSKQQQQSLLRNNIQTIDTKSINMIPPNVAINVIWRGNGPEIKEISCIVFIYLIEVRFYSQEQLPCINLAQELTLLFQLDFDVRSSMRIFNRASVRTKVCV